jgi:hypothetical protein
MKRRGYLKMNETIELGLPGITVWAYGQRHKYLGRVEINAAGLAAYTGKKGNKKLGNMSWAHFFDRLEK